MYFQTVGTGFLVIFCITFEAPSTDCCKFTKSKALKYAWTFAMSLLFKNEGHPTFSNPVIREVPKLFLLTWNLRVNSEMEHLVDSINLLAHSRCFFLFDSAPDSWVSLFLIFITRSKMNVLASQPHYGVFLIQFYMKN